MLNIEEFKNTIRKGLARPNRYKVTISFPIDSPLILLNTANSESISIMCEAAELPGVAVATGDDRQWGPARKIPYVSVYNDLSLTFMCDKDMSAKTLFDAWNDKIIRKSGFKVGYYDDYISTVNIQVLDENNLNNSLYEVECYESYPVEVISIPLAYDNNDSYMKVEVRMAYRYWDTINY